MTKWTIWFCLLLLSNLSEEFFKSSIQKLKEKAQKIYKSKFGKDKTWHFLGHDASEYPGSNHKYLQLNKQKWNEYYDCLQKRKDSLGLAKTITPEALQGFIGYSVKLNCEVCLSPKERENSNLIEWYFAGENDTSLEPIEYTEYVFLEPEDKTLHLYNMKEENTGQYLCRLGNALIAPYFLTVIEAGDSMHHVHSNKAMRGPYAKQPEKIPEHNLVLDTEWSDWSPCSECGKAGVRHKLGYCVVYFQVDSNVTENEVSETHHFHSRKRRRRGRREITWNKKHGEGVTSLHVSKVDMELIKMFKFGIPCRSHILPRSLAILPKIAQRKDEIMTGFCKTLCPESVVFEVKDKNGKVIERANNSAGIYSMLQGLPPLEPPVERRLRYERKGDDIVLVCPGYGLTFNLFLPLSKKLEEKQHLYIVLFSF